ncbi:unnamed protein product [Schistosoma haematobium]|nr:unnamed protein product [Schistosoma haematobium]
MSTPTRKTKKRHSSINAPFKSPLKRINESNSFTDPTINNQNNEINEQPDVIRSQLNLNDTNKQTSSFHTELQHLGKENIHIAKVIIDDVNDNEDNDDLDDNSKIENCINKLLSKRPNQSYIDLELELAKCRNRLHAYNEAKDSCRSQLNLNDTNKQTSSFHTELQHLGKENIHIAKVIIDDVNDNEDNDDLDDNSKIENCINKLLSKRPNQSYIDLELELAKCRNRLHAYNEAKDSCRSQLNLNDTNKQTSSFHTELQHLGKENIHIAKVIIDDVNDNEDNDDLDDNSKIENCINKLLSKRPNQSYIDLELELAKCRNRLHAYNEAKDSCVILFGLLANNRGCLVRELYSEFDLNLDD